MIYTITFNPAWDYVVHVKNMKLGVTNRADSESIMFGGKGINVSAVLKELGHKSVVLGFTAGFTGAALEDELKEKGFVTDFIRLSNGMTRINVKLKSENETEINGQGPDIDEESLMKLFGKLDRLSKGDTLVLAGSVPQTLPEDIYERILQKLSGRGIRTVVDASNELLVNVLKYKPFLVKPNNHELGEIFGVTLNDKKDIEFYARKLLDMGAQNVLVSVGKDGSLLIDSKRECITMPAAKGEKVNSVGAGDSMVAGFIAGYEKTGSYIEALKLGTAAGSATACSLGLASRIEIEEALKTL